MAGTEIPSPTVSTDAKAVAWPKPEASDNMRSNASLTATPNFNSDYNLALQAQTPSYAPLPNIEFVDGSKAINTQADKQSKNKLVIGIDLEDNPPPRLDQKFGRFVDAATNRAESFLTDPKQQAAYLHGLEEKAIGFYEGMDEAKNATKQAAVSAWNALSDGTVDRSLTNFLSKPNAINEPLFNAVGKGFDFMASDPNAVNNALGAGWNKLVEASSSYSQMGDRDRFKVVGELTFGSINPEGSLEAPELMGKIGSRYAPDAVADLKAAYQSLREGAGESEYQFIEKSRQGGDESINDSLRRPIQERFEEAHAMLSSGERKFLGDYNVQVIPKENLSDVKAAGNGDVCGIYEHSRWERKIYLPGETASGAINKDLLYAYRHEIGHAIDRNFLRTPEEVLADAYNTSAFLKTPRVTDLQVFKTAFDSDLGALDDITKMNLGRYGKDTDAARQEVFASLWAHAFTPENPSGYISDPVEWALAAKYPETLKLVKKIAARVALEG